MSDRGLWHRRLSGRTCMQRATVEMPCQQITPSHVLTTRVGMELWFPAPNTSRPKVPWKYVEIIESTGGPKDFRSAFRRLPRENQRLGNEMRFDNLSTDPMAGCGIIQRLEMHCCKTAPCAPLVRVGDSSANPLLYPGFDKASKEGVEN